MAHYSLAEPKQWSETSTVFNIFIKNSTSIQLKQDPMCNKSVSQIINSVQPTHNSTRSPPRDKVNEFNVFHNPS